MYALGRIQDGKKARLKTSVRRANGLPALFAVLQEMLGTFGTAFFKFVLIL